MRYYFTSIEFSKKVSNGVKNVKNKKRKKLGNLFWDFVNILERNLVIPSQISSSVHGILQARILEWVAIPFSRGSSWLRDQTWVSCIAGRFLSVWAIREIWYLYLKYVYIFITEKNHIYTVTKSIKRDVQWYWQ